MDKTPISIALERQIPEFIREEYTVFVEFVKAYYAFLDQTQQRNLEDIRSIENTLDEFVLRFKKELSVVFPTDKLANERFILQHIREFYKTRGSVESFQFLFRALFNKDAQIYYPSKQILRASDGSWIQEKSIFVEQSSGSLFDLAGKIINIETTTKRVHVFCPRVVYYRDNLYEVFIDRAYVQDISIGNSVLSEDGTSVGSIVPCPSKYTIIKGGAGFQVGALYHLPTETGNGSLVKITKIDSVGAIKKLQIISFGLDYESVFYAQLSNKTRQAFAYYNPITSFTVGVYEETEIINGVPTVVVKPRPSDWNPSDSYTTANPYKDGTTGFLDLGYINKQDYFAYDSQYVSLLGSDTSAFYADGTYVGEIVVSFYTNDSNSNVIDGTTAEIKIELGPVAVYPGYYSKSDGFISDESFIQDGKYYQLFSYVIKVEEQVDAYRDIIKTLLHPAGYEMYAEYNIKNSYAVSASPLQAFIRYQFSDIQYVIDDGSYKDIEKLIFDIQSVLHSDSSDIKNVTKKLEEESIVAHIDGIDDIKEVVKGSQSTPIENVIYTATSNFDTINDKKDVVKGSAIDPIHNTVYLASGNFDTINDKKEVVKGSAIAPIENTVYLASGNFDTLIDKKTIVKGSAIAPIENAIYTATSNFDTINDKKDVVKGSAIAPIENAIYTATSNFDTINDKKDVVKGSAIAPIENAIYTATSNFDTTADKKEVVKGSQSTPIENAIYTATSNFDTAADKKQVVKGSAIAPIENAIYNTADAPGQRNVSGAGFVTYSRDDTYSNFGNTPEQYPFKATLTSSDSLGQRNVAGAGFVTYSRDRTYINFGSTPEQYPFDAYSPATEEYRQFIYKGSAASPMQVDSATVLLGGWSWNGSSYILNTPEINISSVYYRQPDLLGFSATLTSGSNVVVLTSGNARALQLGLLLTKISGTGVFGVESRVSSIVDETTFTVTQNHSTSGAVQFYTIGNTPQLADTISSPVDTFPDGSTQNLVKFAFSGSSWNQAVSITNETFDTIRSYDRRPGDTINNISIGTLYYNAYNQNDAADPSTSYSYEAEIYSAHDMRAIS